MSITQTYYLAHTARGKLSSEAARSDHNLRLLVGHANLLDTLMLELAEAEQEQESWFNASVKEASPSKHIQWAETVVEEPEEDWQAEDADSDSSSDSESEFDDEEDNEVHIPLTRVLSRVQQVQVEEYDDDQEEDYESLTLVRSSSHSHSPPELSHDSEDDSSEDESMPLSPPVNSLPTFSEKQREAIVTTSYYSNSQSKMSSSEQAAFFEEGFYLPQRSTISAY